MCTILLSIKPKYIEKIFEGLKKYEFRKVGCKKPVDKIILYATSPVMKVVGEATVEQLLIDLPNIIWNQTKQESGITNKFFSEYYSGKTQAYAYKLGKITQYDIPKDLSSYGIKQAPQSFVYLRDEV